MDINIVGWGSQYAPCNYTNEELCEIFDVNLEKSKQYEDFTGVKQRQMCIDHRNGGIQVVRDDQMATDAAKKALEVAGLESDDIDVIIAVYTSMDYITPGVAERVQSNLKIVQGHAMNLVGGCAELINAFIVAKMFLEQGKAKNILILTTDVANAYYKDFAFPYEWFISGDSGAAFVVSSQVPGNLKVRNMNFQTIGRMQNLMLMPIWGLKVPCPLIAETEKAHEKLEKMADIDKKYRWRRADVMESTMKIFVDNLERIAKELLAEVGGTIEEAYTILPQFNIKMMRECAKRLDMDISKVPLLLTDHGCEGTSAPICTFVEAHKMHEGFKGYKYVLLVSLGINGSYGGVLVERT